MGWRYVPRKRLEKLTLGLITQLKVSCGRGEGNSRGQDTAPHQQERPGDNSEEYVHRQKERTREDRGISLQEVGDVSAKLDLPLSLGPGEAQSPGPCCLTSLSGHLSSFCSVLPF